MTIVDEPLPTAGTTGRPALLCVIVGHVFTSDSLACTRPGCRTVKA